MPRALGSRLITVCGVSKTVRADEDWERVGNQFIIASLLKPEPMSKRGYVPWVRGRFKVQHSLAAFLAAADSRPSPPSPPSPPVPRVKLKLRPPPPKLPPPPPPRFSFPALAPRFKATADRARHMRYELICDLAGVPSIRKPSVPDVPPWALPRPPPPQSWTPARKRPRPRKPPMMPRPLPVAAARAPEPNLLAMGEVDLICWETMPPPTP